MTLIRTYLAVLLAVLLGFAAYGDASAKAMRDATGQMVICTGSGTVTVYVDEDGQPAAPPHPCPECISLALDAGLPGPSGLPDRAGLFAHPPAGPRILQPLPARAAPKARAPPSAG